MDFEISGYAQNNEFYTHPITELAMGSSFVSSRIGYKVNMSSVNLHLHGYIDDPALRIDGAWWVQVVVVMAKRSQRYLDSTWFPTDNELYSTPQFWWVSHYRPGHIRDFKVLYRHLFIIDTSNRYSFFKKLNFRFRGLQQEYAGDAPSSIVRNDLWVKIRTNFNVSIPPADFRMDLFSRYYFTDP